MLEPTGSSTLHFPEQIGAAACPRRPAPAADKIRALIIALEAIDGSGWSPETPERSELGAPPTCARIEPLDES